MYQQTYCGIGIVLYYFHIFTIAFGPGKIGNTSCSCRGFRCLHTVWTQWEVAVKSQLFNWITCYHAPMVIALTGQNKISCPSCSVYVEQGTVAPVKHLCSTWRRQDKAIFQRLITKMSCFNQCVQSHAECLQQNWQKDISLLIPSLLPCLSSILFIG